MRGWTSRDDAATRATFTGATATAVIVTSVAVPVSWLGLLPTPVLVAVFWPMLVIHRGMWLAFDWEKLDISTMEQIGFWLILFELVLNPLVWATLATIAIVLVRRLRQRRVGSRETDARAWRTRAT